MEPKDFIDLLELPARSIQNQTGIPWTVIVAQAALETGWLRYPVADINTGRNSYNLFNIKGKGPAGSVQAMDIEYVDGKPRRVLSEFRAYNSYRESLQDYADLITGSERYAPAFQVRDDPEEFARELQKCGYAQDPRYAEKLIAIMRKYLSDMEDSFE